MARLNANNKEDISRITFGVTENSCKAEIEGFTIEDEGMWTCVSQNRRGKFLSRCVFVVCGSIKRENQSEEFD